MRQIRTCHPYRSYRIPQEEFQLALRQAEEFLASGIPGFCVPDAVAGVAVWDPETWYQAWASAAAQTRRDACHWVLMGDLLEAHRCYLAAAFFYRAGGIFLDRPVRDPRRALCRESSDACWRMAIHLSGGVEGVPPEFSDETDETPGQRCSRTFISHSRDFDLHGEF